MIYGTILEVGENVGLICDAIADDAVLARATCPVRRSGEIDINSTFFLFGFLSTPFSGI